MDRDDPAFRGQSEYTRSFLRVYDAVILGFFLRFVWRCPTSRLVEGYRQHIRDGHLDVGPGTGYFIERSGLPSGSQVTILDPNQNVLDYATRRLPRLEVTAVQADVLKPLPVDGLFNSAALHGVIHCLPGPLTRKSAAVTNVAAVLASDGVLFGMSVLGSSGRQTWLSRLMLDILNRRGTFDNLTDTEEGLKEILAASFEQVELETVGSVAVFVATNPRRAGRHIAPPTPSGLREHGGFVGAVQNSPRWRHYQESGPVAAGWAAITAAVLTVTGLVTLLVFFGTGLPLLGALNDLNTVAMSLVTVPVALALYPVAARGSSPLAAIALGADFFGVALAAVFSLLLVVGVVTFEGSLLPVTLGNGLIGIWLLLTAAILLWRSALPVALGWLGVAGGAGLAFSALAFPALGREHPVIAIAGMSALIGLVGFYAWMGVLLLRGRVGTV